MTNEQPFISFIVTTFNNEKTIIKVLQAIIKQNYPRGKFEIIIVDDNSTDKTQGKMLRFKKDFKNIKFFLKQKKVKKGPAASSNFGIKKARGKFIASIDGDAVIFPDWLPKILKNFNKEKIMIVSGTIYTANPKNIWASYVGFELEDRLLKLKQKDIDSISPCNTVYKKDLFKKVGLFNENFEYYGQDVEFCYRVKQAGYKILLTKETGCYHFWKENFWEALRQIYGTGYGRLIALAKFPQKKTGDSVSDWRLIFQVPLTLIFVITVLLPFLLKIKWMTIISIVIFFIIFLIQVPITIRIIKKTKDFRFIAFPLFLVIRNMTWIWAFLRYNLRSIKN